ncbi:MAG: hypothetical protein AAGA85_20420, partial [Bacteroidota bacterium]
MTEEFLFNNWLAKEYNFAIFNWSQFADEERLEDIEAKLWVPELLSWRDPLGERTTVALPEESNPIVDLMIENYDLLNPPALGGKITIVGHGIGSQLALELAAHMKRQDRAGLLERVALLNGWWSDDELIYEIDGEEMTAAERSLQIAEFLFSDIDVEGNPARQVPMEAYRNIKFDLDEYQSVNDDDDDTELPPFVGSDNDALKQFVVASNLGTDWSEFLEVPDPLNVLTFAEDRVEHEAIYLWYLKSIDFEQQGNILDSVIPQVEEEDLRDLNTADWEVVTGPGFNATATRIELVERQGSGQFFTQITGENTMQSADDEFVEENICICELQEVEDIEQLGVMEVHAAALQEYAHDNDLAIMLRKPHDDTDKWAKEMYANETHLPSPVYNMPVLETGNPCGTPYAGLATINPEIERVRSLIGRDIDDLDLNTGGLPINPLTISNAYRRFMFDSISSNELYVYPMEIFKEEYWNYTFTRALIHKKLERDWMVTADDPQCYLVNFREGQLIFDSYRLHGLYDERTRQTSSTPEGIDNVNEPSFMEEAVIEAINDNINGRTQDYGLFVFNDEEGVEIFDMIQQSYTHDSWFFKNDWYQAGPEMGPQADLIVFTKNGRAYRLDPGAIEKQKEMYQCLGIDWQAMYPDEFEESNPDKVVYYAEADEPIPAESANLGGYPALYNSQSSSPAGKPNSAQKGEGGRYNSVDLAQASRQTYIDWVEANADDYGVAVDEYNVSNLSSITLDDTRGIGMHPHHYQRFAQFAMEFGITLMARNSNPEAVQWIYDMYEGGDYRPKPVTVKGKSIKKSGYEDLPDKEYLDQVSVDNWLSGATGDVASIRFIGPGKAISDDDEANVLDTNCAGWAGLASFDPRTVRGRGVVDPPRDFDVISDACGHTNFEEKYASSLQSKLLGNGNYVFPIPYFANKYQHILRFVNIKSVNNGWVQSSALEDGTNIIHTDQNARRIHLRLVHGEAPLEFHINNQRKSGELPEFGYGGIHRWSAEELDRVVTRMNTDGDEELELVKVEVYLDPIGNGNQSDFDFLWSHDLSSLRPRHTGYPTVYEAYDVQSPVWLEGEAFISFPKPEEYPSLPEKNLAVTWIGFEHAGTKLFNLVRNSTGQLVLPGAGFDGDSLINPMGWQESAENEWKDWNWVRVYYDILKRYYYDFTVEAAGGGLSSNSTGRTIYGDNCYRVKDRTGNNYYSDYDMHGYYFSEQTSDQSLHARRWWKPQFNDPFPLYGRQLINHYINMNLDIPNGDVADLYPESKYNLVISEIIANQQLFNDDGDIDLQRSLPFDLIQHGPQDDWEDRNNYGEAEVNAGPQSDLTMWVPTSDNQVKVYTLTGNTSAFFQEMLYKSIGLHWESIYPQEYYTVQEQVEHERGSLFMRSEQPIIKNQPCIYWSDKSIGCEFTWDLEGIDGAVDLDPENTVPHLKQYKNYYKAHKVVSAPDGTQWDPTLPVSLADQPAAKSLLPITVKRENPTNCDEVQAPQCYSIEQLRALSEDKLRRLTPAMGSFFDQDLIAPGLAYTLEEFVSLTGGNEVANAECIVGQYARFQLGYNEAKAARNEDPWLMLISHPYSIEQVEPQTDDNETYIVDKSRPLQELLTAMCYAQVDEGWVSVANWGRLDPAFSGNALRITNAAVSLNGRITGASEFLAEGSRAEEFLNAESTQNTIRALGLEVSNIYGPHFPSPGYDAGTYSDLRRITDFGLSLDEDEDYRYFTNPSERENYLGRIENGLLYYGDGSIVDTKDLDNVKYIVDCMGRLYLANIFGPESVNATVHSQFLGGGAV